MNWRKREGRLSVKNGTEGEGGTMGERETRGYVDRQRGRKKGKGEWVIGAQRL